MTQQAAHPAEISTRAARKEDHDFLHRLFVDLRAPEFLPLGLPEEQLRALLSSQYDLQQRSYAATYPNMQQEIILLKNACVGRLCWCDLPTQLRLVDVSLLDSARGIGIGSHVLEQLIDAAGAQQKHLVLTVRRDNRAANLYLRLKLRIEREDELYLHLQT